MKKGYYIHFDARIVPGVDKKIGMQINEFRKHFDMDEINIRSKNRSIIKRILGLFPTASVERDYESALEKLKNPDFLYVRRTTCDHEYLSFFKRIKERYPECKIIIEIFTYPYDRDDFAKWNAWPFYLKEKLYRGKLRNYIDRFVTYSDDEEIFGIPTIRTLNGMDVESISPRNGYKKVDAIRLIAVAYMQRQHGYERIIKGVSAYVREKDDPRRIELMIVGDGPEKSRYIKLVKELGIEDYVKFYPNTNGEELDNLFNKADIALVSFGWYKVGRCGNGSTIKAGEYLSRGIPVLTGYADTAIGKDFPYALFFQNDESVIEMEKVISFYDAIYANGTDINKMISDIRSYALDKIDMPVVLKPIFDYIG